MKKSEKSVIVCGIILLILSALFTISIMLQFLDFGQQTPEKQTIFYLLGTVLIQAYGFSSILIPCFLFVAAILLLSLKGTQKYAIYLGASFIPFFTVVVTEKLGNKLLEGDSGAVFGIKLGALILVCFLLIVIEYLAVGLAYEAISSISKEPEDDFSTKKEKDRIKNVKTTLKNTTEITSRLEDLDFVSFGVENKVDKISNTQEDDGEIEELPPVEEIETLEEIQPVEETETIEELEEIQPVDDIEPLEELEEIQALKDVAEPKTDDDDNAFLAEAEAEAESESVTNSSDDAFFAAVENDDIKMPETDDDLELYEACDSADDDFTEEIEIDSDDEFIMAEANDGPEEDDVKQGYETSVAIESDEPIPVDFSALPMVDIFGEEREVEQSIEIDDMYNEEETDFLENPFESENSNESIDLPEVSIDPVVRASEQIAVVPKRLKNAPYAIPAEGLLSVYPDGEYWVIDDETKKAAENLKETLQEFKIEAEVTGIRKGPVITMFEILPAPGVKLSKIVALGDNIALRLAASSVRIVAPIPGKRAVGIEVPNAERAIVSFKEIIERDLPEYKKMCIPVVLGKDITGEAQLLDLAKTPHLLIAGSTGSGKSVCVNSLILSILYKRSPQEVKMILIDPKVVELKLYNDIPHLLTPVITEPKKAFQALQYCLCEMERRYSLLDGMGVRDISSYNRRIVERNIATEKLPYIVIIVDEFADLMATTGKELESTLARLAAMSRAVGIHLVLATQRPSIDVITGLIKANIPTRIAFMVASKTDSRIIIDQVGAEKLLGRGDMLYASAVDPFPVRIQGTFVSDNEVENVVDFVKQYGEPEYIDEEIFVEDDDDGDVMPSLFGDGDDPLYEKALEIVMQAGKASASYIQRRLKIGYNRAARLVEEMEARGIVGPANGSKPREILHVV